MLNIPVCYKNSIDYKFCKYYGKYKTNNPINFCEKLTTFVSVCMCVCPAPPYTAVWVPLKVKWVGERLREKSGKTKMG